MTAHRRLNPLTGRHVLVSPSRLTRPWQGMEEGPAAPEPPAHDPACHLCPGNDRAGGARNPPYEGTFAFDNDFPALTDAAADATEPSDDLLQAEPVRGRTRVLCYSPDHGATLATLPPAGLRAVIDQWCAESAALSAEWRHVQIFENKGAMMGASSPHPHGQVWASDHLPDEVAAEDERQRAWHAAKGAALLAEVAEREADGPRHVVGNARWLAIVPFWATWPFETLLLPRFQVARLHALDAGDREALAEVLRGLLVRYDNLFRTPFPYSMGWHGAPGADAPAPWWRLHAHFHPPLLRSASIRKFMVGYELLAEAQRDLTPEEAAARLREAGDVHYRSGAR